MVRRIETTRPVAAERVVNRSSRRRSSGRHVPASERNRGPVLLAPSEKAEDVALTVIDDFDDNIPVATKELEAIETHLNTLLGLENLNNPSQLE